MSYTNPNPNPKPNPILGHNFIAPDTISYRNLYKILSRGTLYHRALLCSPPGFIGVRVTRFVVLHVCFVDRCLSFCPFSFCHWVVCSSSIYGFWLTLWYLQTLLTNGICILFTDAVVQHDFHFIWCFCLRVIRWMSLMEQELLTLPNIQDPHRFIRVRITRSLVFCEVLCRSLFLHLTIGLYVLFWFAYSDHPVGIVKLFSK